MMMMRMTTTKTVMSIIFQLLTNFCVWEEQKHLCCAQGRRSPPLEASANSWTTDLPVRECWFLWRNKTWKLPTCCPGSKLRFEDIQFPRISMIFPTRSFGKPVVQKRLCHGVSIEGIRGFQRVDQLSSYSYWPFWAHDFVWKKMQRGPFWGEGFTLERHPFEIGGPFLNIFWQWNFTNRLLAIVNCHT